MPERRWEYAFNPCFAVRTRRERLDDSDGRVGGRVDAGNRFDSGTGVCRSCRQPEKVKINHGIEGAAKVAPLSYTNSPNARMRA